MPKKSFDPCKANACKIQTCLKENKYQEDNCLEVLEQMRQCCIKFKSESLCCEGIDITKTYNISSKSKSLESEKKKYE
ncbi:hypothetical protein PVAND_002353 [Polypedilum vanderplanki]|uniref:Cx9C motif-containing protein 4 n=1 Tax=Polypedilum vanderplanki TaxID=319348 RepID=A0A9J6BQQ3_POLVA|nr:hypothetical protein PVAND_002353 [Polypedilum vanderplanki]